MRKDEVQFHSGSLVLRGELYLPDRKPASAILVCHAMHAEGFRWLPLYREFAEKAAERGFACLVFDFRGCGKSEGQFDYGWGEQQDARAALDFLVGHEGIDPAAVFVVGRSLGGTVALYSLVHDRRVKGFALWAAPPDHHRNVRNFIIGRYGNVRYFLFLALSYIDQFRDVTRAMRIEVFGLRLRLKDLRGKLMTLNGARLLSEIEHPPPVLLLIGDKDEYVTLSEARGFEKSVNGTGGRLVVLNTGHTFKGVEEDAISATLEWFQELSESKTEDDE